MEVSDLPIGTLIQNFKNRRGGGGSPEETGMGRFLKSFPGSPAPADELDLTLVGWL
jgi:hypothetical protein